MFNPDNYKNKFEEVITFLKRELSTCRTGRATPALVEELKVDVYGARTPLLQLASINAPDPKTIIIQPWDKNILKDIEKTISLSQLNVTPLIDKDIIRISLPPMTEENRNHIVKIIHQKAEVARISIRRVRDTVKSEIERAHEEGDIREDEKFKSIKKLDELTKEYTVVIKDVSDAKEGEVLTI